MKASSLLLAVFFIIFICLSTSVHAQLGDILKKKVQEKAEKEVEETIDEALSGDERTAEEDTSSAEGEKDAESQRLRVWSKYDFVPGDEIIFEDDLAAAGAPLGKVGRLHVLGIPLAPIWEALFDVVESLDEQPADEAIFRGIVVHPVYEE